MMKNRVRTAPRWLFVLLAIGTSYASGIYMGILSAEGTSNAVLIRVIGFGVLGLIMAWGSIATPRGT